MHNEKKNHFWSSILLKIKNSKFFQIVKLIFWPIAYGAIIISLCWISTLVFKNNYYSSIYVSGESMSPTLKGSINEADYGIVDKHQSALKRLKRWQIVTTHYPSDDRLMIKRVLFLPGDTFKVVNGEMYLSSGTDEKGEYTWEHLQVDTDETFHRINENAHAHDYPITTLASDEYFVAGDNWDKSLDSFEKGPIEFSYLVGVVVEMQGICKIQNGVPIDKIPYSSPRYFWGVDF